MYPVIQLCQAQQRTIYFPLFHGCMLLEMINADVIYDAGHQHRFLSKQPWKSQLRKHKFNKA